MKVISIAILSLFAILVGIILVKGINTTPSKLSIFDHPSNFKKPKIEVVEKIKTEKGDKNTLDITPYLKRNEKDSM